MRWRRKAGALVALAVGALAPTACGHGNQLVQTRGPEPAAAVAGAAQKSLAAGTQHLGMQVTVDGDPMMSMDGAGTADGTRFRGTMEMPGGMSAEYRMVDGTMYMTMSGPDGGFDISQMTGGKSWLAIPFDDVTGGGMDLGSAAAQQQQGLGMLDLLTEAGATVVRVGGDQLEDGTPATHYRATVDVRKSTTSGGVLSDEWGDMAARLLGDHTAMDVWVDSDGFARRLEYGVDLADANVPGVPSSGDLRYVIEFDHYGEPIDVEAPPASDVASFEDVFGSLGDVFGQLGGLGGLGGSGGDGPN
jgi:hypothetical protein